MRSFTATTSGILFVLVCESGLAAGEYFATSFELPGNEPGIGWDPNDEDNLLDQRPVWKLPPAFMNSYGTNGRIDVSEAASHSGSRSLIVNYTGDNSFCNICGSQSFSHVDNPEHDGVGYFVAVDDGDVWGNNLTVLEDPNKQGTKDGPRAEVGKIVYNRSNAYSKWIITGITSQNDLNDRLNLRLVNRGTTHTSDDQAFFSAGDDVTLTKRCGVDGTSGIIAGDYDRDKRSDCNGLVNWFGQTEPNDGTTNPRSVFTRYYVMSELANNTLHQKLHYYRGQAGVSGNDGKACAARLGLHTVVDTHFDELQFNIKGLNETDPDLNVLYRPGVPDSVGNMLPAEAVFERGVWYYIEEEFQAATLNSMDSNNCPIYNNDGSYRLWFSRAEDAVTSISQGAPSFEVTNIALPPIAGGSGTHISFWGNIQHGNHTVGKWYIDDVSIGSSWSGPVAPSSSAANLPPPAAPITD